MTNSQYENPSQRIFGNRLTILLTLKDRAQFTLRWMHYAEKMRFPFNVLLADGGLDENIPKILSNRDNFPNVNYEYVRYPYDLTYSDFYAKVVDAMGRINTPFLVMADNDDFYLVDGLTRSINFLQEHPDYSSCRGIISGALIKPNDHYGKFSQVYGRRTDIFFSAQSYPPGSTLENTALQRVQQYFTTYRTNWYDVIRTDLAREIFQELKDLNPRDLILAQHIPHQLGNAAGKIYRGSYLYLVRQAAGPESSDRNETLKKGDHFDRMFSETWSSDINNFFNAIASAITSKDGIPQEDARRLVQEGYRNYMAPHIIDCLLARMPPTHRLRIIRNFIHKVGELTRTLCGLVDPDSMVAYFVPAHRFIRSHSEFKAIYEFLTSTQILSSAE